ncbi:hypothetical protein [uncultured Sphingorhabdus sp.]|uniref:hypothetical protein n=1 Tax=uncultured Sphingorhabdus sp. TaxID=1686106 RepID=UPI00262534E8|nr:hypothetical protein [uncultured Sphingorhabdus sp.]HMS21617.1 hypothetical protein [Sphingorhabdus sp.]
MLGQKVLEKLTPEQLAAAFPASFKSDAIVAAQVVVDMLAAKQWTGRYQLASGGGATLIPSRLRFDIEHFDEAALTSEQVLMVRALLTKSTDGFIRQRAAQSLLLKPTHLVFPFIVGLLGEYVIEILHDINAALPNFDPEVVRSFIIENPAYYRLTKDRIASYWNCYYRQTVTRRQYVGFQVARAFDQMAKIHLR